MNILKKLYCRAVQLCFHMALPLLPYREPKRLSSINELPRLLTELKKKAPLIITDRGIIGTGIVDRLTDILKKDEITCSVYSDTCAKPTVKNAEEANPLYPVPKLMNAGELEKFYYQVGGINRNVKEPK